MDIVFCLLVIVNLQLVSAVTLHFPDQHWKNVPASQVGLDEVRLAKGLDAIRRTYSVHEPVSMFVTRHGLSAWHGGELLPSNKSQIWSVGKSVTALLVGKALARGLLNATDVKIPLSNSPRQAASELPIRDKSWFSGGAQGGPLRTWQQILTMTSDFGLLHPKPGKVAAYNCNAVEFCAATLQKSIFGARTMEEMITNELLSVINAEDGLVLPNNMQISGYGGGMSMSSRDLARLGLLLLADGRWKETRLVSSKFAREATRVQVPGTASLSSSCGTEKCTLPQSRGRERMWNILDLTASLPYNASGHARMGGDVGFGYMIWAMPFPGAVHMSGQYGQYVIIDSVNDLVIAVVQSGRPVSRPSASDYLRVVHGALMNSIRDMLFE